MQAAIGVDATTTSSSSSSTRRNTNREDASSLRSTHNTNNRTATLTLRKHAAAVYDGQPNKYNRSFLYDDEDDHISSFSLLSSSSPSSSSTATSINKMTIKSRIAFGSCNDQDRINNLWKIIESRDPVAFIWGGDAIYADNKPLPQAADDDDNNNDTILSYLDWTTIRDMWYYTAPNGNMNSQNSLHQNTKSTSTCGTPARVKKLYQDQLSNPDYKRLVESSNITIFGTIDGTYVFLQLQQQDVKNENFLLLTVGTTHVFSNITLCVCLAFPTRFLLLLLLLFLNYKQIMIMVVTMLTRHSNTSTKPPTHLSNS